MIKETSCWELVPQDSGSWEEADQVELTSLQRDVEGIWVVCDYISGMASSCCEGLPRRGQGT